MPLSAIGELEIRPELSATTRFNGMRSNIVKGFTTVDALPINVAEATLERLEAEGFELPPGLSLGARRHGSTRRPRSAGT